MTTESSEDEVKRAVRLALLEQRMTVMEETIPKILSTLEDLVKLKYKGEGSLWVLVALGGLVGAAISNWKIFLSIFKG